MAVGVLDGAILAVGNQFRSLVDAHPPASFHSLFLGLVMTTAALCVFTFYIPTTVGIGDDMMFFSGHNVTSSKDIAAGALPVCACRSIRMNLIM